MIDKQIGPYKILEVIGYGGMGVVYRSVHTTLEQEVAIKALSPQYVNDEDMQRRFLSEAKIQAKLSHPNVVNIMNYIEDENGKFLVMEYARGQTLQEVLKTENKLTIERSLSIVYPILDALEYMHSREIIHRDIKPSNIILTENNGVKVTDFGIARILSHRRGTNSGLTGSFVYMSPEQIMCEATTEASDIYSLGIMLYEMLVGKVPYDDVSEFKIMTAHIQQTPEHPSIIDEKIPVSLGKVILKAISKEPEDRHKNVGELRGSLESSTDRSPGYSDIVRKYKIPEIKLFRSLSKPDFNKILSNIPFEYYKRLISNFRREVSRRQGYYIFLFLLVFSLVSAYGFMRYNKAPGNVVYSDGDFAPSDIIGKYIIIPDDVSWMYVSEVLESDKIGEDKKKIGIRRSRPRISGTPGPSKVKRNEEDLKEVLKRTNILPVQ